jgi:hypothetical protein
MEKDNQKIGCSERMPPAKDAKRGKESMIFIQDFLIFRALRA